MIYTQIGSTKQESPYDERPTNPVPNMTKTNRHKNTAKRNTTYTNQERGGKVPDADGSYSPSQLTSQYHASTEYHRNMNTG